MSATASIPAPAQLPEMSGELVGLADRMVAQFWQLPAELREMVVERMASKLASRALGSAEVTANESEMRPLAAPAGPSDPEYRAPRFATAAEMCRELGFKRTWAYQHKTELGARVMPTAVTQPEGTAEAEVAETEQGKPEATEEVKPRKSKPRMRFDMEIARAFWASCSIAEATPEPEPESEPKPATPRRRPVKKRPSARGSGTTVRAVPNYKFA